MVHSGRDFGGVREIIFARLQVKMHAKSTPNPRTGQSNDARGAGLVSVKAVHYAEFRTSRGSDCGARMFKVG